MSSPKPLVSFALLSYKQESFIRKAIEGVFSQTYSPLEIIISDDASPDGTFEIIQEMAAAYRGPHKLILNRNEQNLGIGPHVKKVFGMASGEWLVGAAGDDISLPHRACHLVDAAIHAGPNCMGVASNWVDIDMEGNTLESESGASIWHTAQKGLIWEQGIKGCYHALCDGTMMLPGCSAMWNTRLIRDWPDFIAGLMYEDLSLSCRAHLSGRMVTVDEVLVHYRRSPGAVTNQLLDPDPVKRQEQRKRQTATQRARLHSFDQFLLDLEFIERANGSRLPDHELIERILAHKELEARKLDWWDLTAVQRIREIAAGRYPFGNLRAGTLLHLLPRENADRLRTLLAR